MVEEFETEIDGIAFRMSQMPCTKASVIADKLLGMIAPALGGLVKKEQDGDVEFNWDGVSGALQSAMKVLDPTVIAGLQRELLATCQVRIEGEWMPVLKMLDVALTGKVLTLYKLRLWALEVNFKDFSSALAALGIRRRKGPANARGASTTSEFPGLAGESSKQAGAA